MRLTDYVGPIQGSETGCIVHFNCHSILQIRWGWGGDPARFRAVLGITGMCPKDMRSAFNEDTQFEKFGLIEKRLFLCVSNPN